MRLLKRSGVILLLLLSTLPLQAQRYIVKNVRFIQRGETIEINYDLDGNANSTYTVSVALSNDGGVNFGITPATVTGDVGENIRPGRNKQIIWLMAMDYPNGLDGDSFVFAVDAKQTRGRKNSRFGIGGYGSFADLNGWSKPVLGYGGRLSLTTSIITFDLEMMYMKRTSSGVSFTKTLIPFTIKLNFIKSRHFRMYLGGGAAYHIIELKMNDWYWHESKSSEVRWIACGGMQIQFAGNLALFAEAKRFFNSSDDLIFTAGAELNF